jgi:hypothetical protein
MKHGNHEPSLGCLPVLWPEVLGRQHDVELHPTEAFPPPGRVSVHVHPILVKERRQRRKIGVLRA